MTREFAGHCSTSLRWNITVFPTSQDSYALSGFQCQYGLGRHMELHMSDQIVWIMSLNRFLCLEYPHNWISSYTNTKRIWDTWLGYTRILEHLQLSGHWPNFERLYNSINDHSLCESKVVALSLTCCKCYLNIGPVTIESVPHPWLIKVLISTDFRIQL